MSARSPDPPRFPRTPRHPPGRGGTGRARRAEQQRTGRARRGEVVTGPTERREGPKTGAQIAERIGSDHSPIDGPQRFAPAVAVAVTTWPDLAEWQQMAIMAISPELASRLVAADEVTDELAESEIDEDDIDDPDEQVAP